jgi:hypothetical protein
MRFEPLEGGGTGMSSAASVAGSTRTINPDSATARRVWNKRMPTTVIGVLLVAVFTIVFVLSLLVASTRKVKNFPVGGGGADGWTCADKTWLERPLATGLVNGGAGVQVSGLVYFFIKKTVFSRVGRD